MGGSSSSQSSSSGTECKFMTWNMRGATHGGESTYQKIKDFINRGYQIIALQESGPSHHPTQSNLVDITSSVPLSNPDNIKDFSYHASRWNLGSSSRTRNVTQYFLETDKNAKRVNLSIISVLPAVEMIVLHAPGSIRPILGIRIGDGYIFNIHANSGRDDSTAGSNSAESINRVYAFIQKRGSTSWILMGDFNREPFNVMQDLRQRFPQVARNVEILYQTEETHEKRKILDFAVVPRGTKGTAIRLTDYNLNFSDHMPVVFSSQNLFTSYFG